MNNSFLKSAVFVIGTALTLSSGAAFAQEAQSLDQLLKFVKQGQASEAKESKQREARFKNAKNRQSQLLAEAKAMRKQEEERSARLEKNFEENEIKVLGKQQQLKERLGTLTELFGHLTSTVSGSSPARRQSSQDCARLCQAAWTWSSSVWRRRDGRLPPRSASRRGADSTISGINVTPASSR